MVPNIGLRCPLQVGAQSTVQASSVWRANFFSLSTGVLATPPPLVLHDNMSFKKRQKLDIVIVALDHAQKLWI